MNYMYILCGLLCINLIKIKFLNMIIKIKELVEGLILNRLDYYKCMCYYL